MPGRDGQGLGDRAQATVLRAPRQEHDGWRMGGVFRVRCVKPDGTVRWEDDAPNMIVTQGLSQNLEVMFRNGPQVYPWYMGLVDNAAGTFAAGDTMGTKGWTESGAYSSATGATTGNRPPWNPGPSGGATSISNPATINFVMNAHVTIKGLFLSSANPIGTTTSPTQTLFSEAGFSAGPQECQNGDTLQCTYTLSNSSTTTG